MRTASAWIDTLLFSWKFQGAIPKLDNPPPPNCTVRFMDLFQENKFANGLKAYWNANESKDDKLNEPTHRLDIDKPYAE